MPGDREADQALGVTVRRFQVSRRTGFFSLYGKVLKAAQEDRADLILWGFISPPAFVGYLAARRLGLPFIVMVHRGDLKHMTLEQRWPFRAMALQALRRADLVVANSQYMAERSHMVGARMDRTIVIHPGVDICVFMPQQRDSLLASTIGVQGRKVILTVARLVPYKGHESIIRLLPEIARQVPSVCYLSIGGGPDEERLGRTAQEVGVADRVILHSAVENEQLPPYYALADVFVLPTGEEGFGIAAVEASACGIPVVGVRSGGLLDVIRDGETGLLAEPHGPKTLKDALISLLTDPSRASALGVNGRRRAEGEFAWERVHEKFYTSFMGLLQARKQSSGTAV